MRQIIKALALSIGLLPALAAAQVPQFPQTLPANTVIGRLGTGPGPSQAIPFSQLGPNLITNHLAVTSPLSITGLNLKILGTAGTILGSASTVPAFTATPTLGVASTTSGTLTLANSGNSGTVTIGAPSTSTTWTLTLPTTAGSNGQALVTDGNGATSWAAGSGTVNSGTAGRLAYYATTAAALSGNANLTISSGALTVGVAGSQAGTLLLSGGTSGTTTLAVAAAASGTLTLPAATDTLVGRATTDTLTNKTLTSPAINTPTITAGTLSAITGLGIRDTTAAFDVTVAATSTSATITAGRTLTLDMGNVAHTLQFGTTANTITFPSVASDTVAMLAASQTITNKTFTSSTYNGNTFTTGTGTLTIAAGKTLTASNTLTLAGTDATTITFQGTDTYVGRTTTDTLTNKTLTSPTINGGTATALTGFGIRSTGSGAFDLTLANTENLTAGRTLTLTLNNAARTINMSGNLTLAAAFTTAGSNAITLTSTGTTAVTLPISGTLATIDQAQTFSASNIFSALTQFTDLKFSSGKLYPTSDSATALQVMKADGLTRVVAFDTTNARVGINKTAGAYDLDVNGATNVGGILTFGTLSATSLAASTSTITGLTVNNSPSSSNDYLLYYSAADGAVRKATVGAIAAGATAGVSSLNGLTGGLSVVAGSGLSVSAAGSSVTVADYLDPGSITNCTISVTAPANALTVALKTQAGADPSASSPCTISFRNATATTGDYTPVAVTAATSVALGTTGSTLGAASSSTPFHIYVTAWNNAGTVVLGLSNQSAAGQIYPLIDDNVQSSTACNGCTNATSAGVFYTTAAQTSKAIRILARLSWESGLATAGTWNVGPSKIVLMGPGMKLPGDTVQSFFLDAVTAVTTSSPTNSTTDGAKNLTLTSAANIVNTEFGGLFLSNGATGQAKIQVFRGSAACTTAIGPFQLSTLNLSVSTSIHTTARDFPYASSTTAANYTGCVNAANSVSITFPYQNNGYFRIHEIQG